MKHFAGTFYRFTIVFITIVNYTNAQSAIGLLRYNDNFAFIKEDSLKKGFNRLKYIEFGENNFISFGGEIREQLQLYHNINFGDLPSKFSSINAHQLNHRLMFHANIESGNHFRFFIQMNNTLQFMNVNPPSPEIDVNHLSVHQAFSEFLFNKWKIRIGRQEVFYGNHRIFTVREGPNTRQTFDGMLVKKVFKNGTMDFFALSKTISKKFIFDDEFGKERSFGFYSNWLLPEKRIGLDFYGLNFQSDQRKYKHNSGPENRQTVGFRLYSDLKKFNFEIEGTYQAGQFNSLSIDAYNVFADLNITILQKKKARIGLAANISSGDKNNSDNKLNTYNLLYAKPAYGLAIPLGSANLISINPYFKITPVPKLNILTQVFFLQVNSNQDGLYSPFMTMVRPQPETTSNSNSMYMGTFFVLETSYQQSENFTFYFDASYFNVGGFLKETGKGKDLTYVSFKSTFKF